MVRRFLVFAGALALAAPLVQAQAVTVCVFQAQKGHKMKNAVDANGLVEALSRLTLPGGAPIQATAIADVAPKAEDDAAQQQHCTWIVDAWREDLPANTPNYGGTLVPSGAYTNVEEGSLSEAPAHTLLEYELRKPGSDKKIAHGESDDVKPYPAAAQNIVKKLGKAK